MNKSNLMKDYATIEAYYNKVPVSAFGYTRVYGVSPDLLPNVVLQNENKNPRIKIHPKPWEIKENKMGFTPTREPKTCWCSRGHLT